MDITNVINKIHSDSNIVGATINDTLKYEYDYNGYPVSLYYTDSDALKHILRIVIEVGDTTYLIVETFSECDCIYEMKTYIDPELYNALKFNVLYVNKKCRTTPFFEEMKSSILNHTPVIANVPVKVYTHNHPEYKPYFETVIRKKMSETMKKRIWDSYDSNLAKKIMDYCNDMQTLRFTTDITRAHDIKAFFD